MRSLIILVLFTSLFSVISAQSLSGPVESFVFDAPTQSLRAVNGFPGSATFGPVLLSGVEYGSVAPHKDYAIAFKDGHCLFVSGLDSGRVSTTPLPGVFGLPDGTVWSGDSSVAILYSRSGNWIQVLAGMPKAPSANPYRSLAVLGGALSAVAADADGKQIAIAMHSSTDGVAGGVYLTTSNQEFMPLVEMSNPIALSFSENSASLYALDGTALKLASVTISDWNSQVVPLAGLRNPFAILAGHDSANQPVVFVASLSDRLVGVYNPASQKIQTILHLGFQPTGLQDFGKSSFLIGSRLKAGDPLWLFSTAPRPAVYFVPAAALAVAKGVE
jgi:hypothetical protein